MPITTNEVNARAKGGTELCIEEIQRHVRADLLEKVEIIPGRFRGFQHSLPRIFWVHDTAEDPEMNFLSAGGWKMFNLFVFVSHWQQSAFINRFGIPWSRCRVIGNGIDSFETTNDWTNILEEQRFIYHTTPHRGLELLLEAFPLITEKLPNAVLDVYSSFEIYGNKDRDMVYNRLFSKMEKMPNVRSHGTVSNQEIREALLKSHIFLYPSIWPETNCRALVEAMMAGCACIHSNYGCLYETAANLTGMYPYTENQSAHVKMIVDSTTYFVEAIMNQAHSISNFSKTMSARAHGIHAWNIKKMMWEATLIDLIEGKL